jgi:tetratricopeptide (TPR) repeat protein
MKLIFLGLAVWLMVGITYSQDTYSDDADSAYLSGDFLRAIELYESIIANSQYGEISYAIYFNLGQAYSQIGEWGEALVNYHRAYRLNPRDGDIAHRIATIRAIRPDKYTEESSLWVQIAQLTSLFTRWELELFAILLWSFMWLIGIIFWRNRAYRKFLRYPLIVMLCIACALLILTISRVSLETSRPLAILTSNTTEVFSGAGIDYFAMFSVSEGAEMRVLEQSGIWAKIELPDGQIGWVRISTITIV